MHSGCGNQFSTLISINFDCTSFLVLRDSDAPSAAGGGICLTSSRVAFAPEPLHTDQEYKTGVLCKIRSFSCTVRWCCEPTTWHEFDVVCVLQFCSVMCMTTVSIVFGYLFYFYSSIVTAVCIMMWLLGFVGVLFWKLIGFLPDFDFLFGINCSVQCDESCLNIPRCSDSGTHLTHMAAPSGGIV